MMNKTLKTMIVSLMVSLFSQPLLAKNNEKITIPKLSDAQVFATFNDELPAVINYFTNSSIEQVITFYQDVYGKTTHRENKHQRLALFFTTQSNDIRVIVSEQNNKRQVDVIVTAK